MNEKFTLSCETFSEHLQVMFKDLYQEGRYTDVTLVSDDQTQFKAHKIVLSACSPVFKKIIDSNPSQHPLIYLRGVQSSEMESILQFMYLGEATFYHERMGEFIKVAQDLEVKQISDGLEMGGEEEVNIHEKIPDDEMEETCNQVMMLLMMRSEDTEDQMKEGKLCQRQPKKDKSFITNSKDTKKRRTKIIQRPLKKEMLSTTSPQCPECGAVFTRKESMRVHYKSKHEGVKYSCPECAAVYLERNTMMKHYKSKHKGVKYPCNQCNYQATQSSGLNIHIKNVHEGVRHPCNQCDYKATTRSNLLKHIQSKH